LADQKKVSENYRSQLLAMEADAEGLRDQADAAKEALKV